jgi:general secretion pathway protein G
MIEFLVFKQDPCLDGAKVMIRKTQSKPVDHLLRRAAFTLMEMLVVVAIIVVLAGVGGAYLIGRLNDAKVDATKIRAREISQAIETFFVDNGQYPTQLTDLLVINPTTGKGPYLKNQEYITAPLTGQLYTYDPTGSIGMSHGNTVPTPDVYVMNPATGQPIGNFK